MRRLFIILGVITSTLAVIGSVTPLSKFAFIPAVVGLLLGLIAFYLSREKHYPKKSIQLIFLLTLISLSITSYKALFNVIEEDKIEELPLKENKSNNEAPEDLNDLNDLNDLKQEAINKAIKNKQKRIILDSLQQIKK